MHIAVLLGGASAERDVSIASASRIIDALRSLGHHVTGVDPATGALTEAAERAMRETRVKTTPPSLEALARLGDAGSKRRGRGEFIPDLITLPVIREADVAFIGLHGGQGEDGTLQAILDSADVPYTGSGHLASALAMDKDLSKVLFRAAGVATADWVMTPPPIDEQAVVERLKLPLIVKPSKQGSTVGLSVVSERAQLAPAIALAARYDDEVMLEQFIPGRELTVGVLGDVALPVGEIFPKHAIYDYECKYTVGMAHEEFPAKLTPSETAEIQRQAVAAFRALKLRGCARIDFRMRPSGDLACLEANTLPGMTGTSLIPQAAAAAGIAFPELCERIVQLALGHAPAA
jgi:D-alanine-D-alanine ligase